MGTLRRRKPNQQRNWKVARLRAKGQADARSVGAARLGHGVGRRSALWILGLVGAAGATLLTSTLLGIPAQLVDPSEAKDTLRSGPELSVGVEITQLDDEGLSKVVPGAFQPSAHARQIISQSMGAVSPEFLSEVRSAGGINLEKLTLRLVVEGRRNQEVRILDIRPQIVERTPPVDGTLFDIPPQGGGATMKMFLDLDKAQPVVSEVIVTDENEPKAGPAFFGNTTISLKDREEQVIILRAVAIKYYAIFNLIFEYRVGDQTKTMTVTNQGQPFRVTGPHLGSGPDELSYQEAFELQGDFSMCRVADPRHISWRSGIRCA